MRLRPVIGPVSEGDRLKAQDPLDQRRGLTTSSRAKEQQGEHAGVAGEHRVARATDGPATVNNGHAREDVQRPAQGRASTRRSRFLKRASREDSRHDTGRKNLRSTPGAVRALRSEHLLKAGWTAGCTHELRLSKTTAARPKARVRVAVADSALVEERQVEVVGKHDGSGEQRFL